MNHVVDKGNFEVVFFEMQGNSYSEEFKSKKKYIFSPSIPPLKQGIHPKPGFK